MMVHSMTPWEPNRAGETFFHLYASTQCKSLSALFVLEGIQIGILAITPHAAVVARVALEARRMP